MAYATSALSSRELNFIESTTVAKPSLFSRLVKAMIAARARQVDREIAHYLVDSAGGKFTDQAEREIEQRFMSNQTRW
jgi:DNA-directed RNA polymerase subunit K/omega